MSRWNDKVLVDARDYGAEARNLIRPLSDSQCYNLYDIVLKKLKMSNSETRDNELKAVKNAIDNRRHIDSYRLRSIETGFKSDMAQNGRPKDGQTKINNRKV